MILEVAVYDFQSIEFLKLEFGAITVFRGESRQGKSAFIRALRCLTSNPKGSYFIRSKATSSKVEVKTDRGLVSWEKSRSTSAVYKVQVGDGPVQVFEKNTEVPREVFQVLNVPDLIIDKDLEISLHFSNQHEAPFLIPPMWGTASSIAKALGKITNVDRASQAMRLCAADLKEAKVSLSSAITGIKEHEERLLGFGQLDSQIVAADRLKSSRDEVESLSKVDCTPQVDAARQSLDHSRRSKVLVELLRMIPHETFQTVEILKSTYDRLYDDVVVAKGLIRDAQTTVAHKATAIREVDQASSALDQFCSAHKSCPLCEGKGELVPC